jgi:acetyl esterase/lipase
VAFSAAAVRADEAKAPEKAPAKCYEVELVPDVPYYEGDGADKVKHKLDLYLPKGKKDFPVIFFVHGGAWSYGDKNSHFGLYKTFGNYWAGQGIGTVVTNYRLSPGVTHPEHVKDVARAFAWTYRNIAKYRGRPDEIFVCGHSAGGHLIALLATDESYLKAEGLGLRAVKGAIPLSGVYTIPEHIKVFESIFGTDAEVCKAASPSAHVHAGVPPFLIIYADGDLAVCGKGPSEAFCRVFADKKCEARALEVKERNHMTLFTHMRQDGDPVGEAIRGFITRHTP